MKNGGAHLILFGSTGDLTAKKLLPALNNWFTDESPLNGIWCLGRRPYTTPEYLSAMEAKSGKSFNADVTTRLQYLSMDHGEPEGYLALRSHLDDCTDHDTTLLFYLAVKPDAFAPILAHLSASGLFDKGNPKHRILFEKPFGSSLETACAIQESVLENATEDQIYRIDHYLSKDMVRNILSIRFANRIFEDSWHGGAIETVRIFSHETVGVEERLDYYDTHGAISDMFQSHLLQLLALVALRPISDFSAETLRSEKKVVLGAVTLCTDQPVITGQYMGYDQQKGVSRGSTTETYLRVNLKINLPEWQDTCFVLETGKKLHEKRTEIHLEFKPHNFCLGTHECVMVPPNRLIIQIHPKEGVELHFNSKAPGYGYELDPVNAHYCHDCRITGNIPEEYVKLLKDALEGDHTLFTSFDELKAQWKIADELRNMAGKPLPYEPGSHGPAILNEDTRVRTI